MFVCTSTLYVQVHICTSTYKYFRKSCQDAGLHNKIQLSWQDFTDIFTRSVSWQDLAMIFNLGYGTPTNFFG